MSLSNFWLEILKLLALLFLEASSSFQFDLHICIMSSFIFNYTLTSPNSPFLELKSSLEVKCKIPSPKRCSLVTEVKENHRQKDGQAILSSAIVPSPLL